MAENMNNLYQILVVSEEAATRELLLNVLQGPGRSVELRDTPRAALELLRQNPADVIFVDPVGQGVAAAKLAEQVRQCCPRAHVISCAGHWRDDNAGQAKVSRADLMLRETANVGEVLQLADTR